MAEEKNLLLRLPCLNVEDLEAIAGAVGVGPSGRLTKYRYYRDAARDPAFPAYIALLDRKLVIDKLRGLPFWPQAREALRKLETPGAVAFQMLVEAQAKASFGQRTSKRGLAHFQGTRRMSSPFSSIRSKAYRNVLSSWRR